MILNVVATVLVVLFEARDTQRIMQNGEASLIGALALSIIEGGVILWAVWR